MTHNCNAKIYRKQSSRKKIFDIEISFLTFFWNKKYLGRVFFHYLHVSKRIDWLLICVSFIYMLSWSHSFCLSGLKTFRMRCSKITILSSIIQCIQFFLICRIKNSKIRLHHLKLTQRFSLSVLSVFKTNGYIKCIWYV